MKRTLILLGLFPLILAQAAAPKPLKVSVIVAPGPCFVGQGVEFKVEVEGAPEPPSVEPTRKVPATIRPLAGDPSRPNVARFLVVPERPGWLDLPPFLARSGGRSGTSRPSRLDVANVPADGRGPAFLGGVGSFQVRAEAEPTGVRAGQALEFRVELTGPAAWGSFRTPDLSEWVKLKSMIRVEPISDVLEGGETPVRTFRYRLRASKPGRMVLPPVKVSAFDPSTRRFMTRATSGLPILVEGPPRFDPARLDYAPAEVRGPRTPAVGIGLGLVAAAGLASWALWRRKKARPVDARALALELAGRLDSVRAVSEGLTTFLARADGRSPGVLTPPEAYEGVARVTGDRDVARRAEGLMARCDRARYGGLDEDPTGLVDEGREVFGRIAEVLKGEGRGGGGPGEAAETAKLRG